MHNENEESPSLLNLVLPKGILEYFTVNKLAHTEETVNIYLSEKNIVPQEYVNDKLTSKGFFDEIKVQDFPLRGKDVFLYIKRRKWQYQLLPVSTKKYLCLSPPQLFRLIQFLAIIFTSFRDINDRISLFFVIIRMFPLDFDKLIRVFLMSLWILMNESTFFLL